MWWCVVWRGVVWSGMVWDWRKVSNHYKNFLIYLLFLTFARRDFFSLRILTEST